jgi:hypothetical protein
VEKTKSRDGTEIAFDRIGEGPPVILIGGAFSWRRWKGFVELADLLAPGFTVLNYDPRGRGDSGDTKPYALQREFEDLQAMISAAGGAASVWGLSAGPAVRPHHERASRGQPESTRGDRVQALHRHRWAGPGGIPAGAVPVAPGEARQCWRPTATSTELYGRWRGSTRRPSAAS